VNLWKSLFASAGPPVLLIGTVGKNLLFSDSYAIDAGATKGAGGKNWNSSTATRVQLDRSAPCFDVSL
jgi:hypothetical protein